LGIGGYGDHQRLAAGEIADGDLAGADGGDSAGVSFEGPEDDFFGGKLLPVRTLAAAGTELIADGDFRVAAGFGVGETDRIGSVAAKLRIRVESYTDLGFAGEGALAQADVAKFLGRHDTGDAALDPVAAFRIIAAGDLAGGHDNDAAGFPRVWHQGHEHAVTRRNCGDGNGFRLLEVLLAGRDTLDQGIRADLHRDGRAAVRRDQDFALLGAKPADRADEAATRAGLRHGRHGCEHDHKTW